MMAEMEALFRQDPDTKKNGGWQNLMVGLQEKCDRAHGTLNVTTADREKIKRYAFGYGNGGWENRLVTTFGRHLGPKLDREG